MPDLTAIDGALYDAIGDATADGAASLSDAGSGDGPAEYMCACTLIAGLWFPPERLDI
jgi:hypothetical protein